MIEIRSSSKRTPTPNTVVLRSEEQTSRKKVSKSVSDYALGSKREINGRANYDDKVSVISNDVRNLRNLERSPSLKKKGAWRSFSRLTQNSRTRSVSRLFNRIDQRSAATSSPTSSLEQRKLRPSRSLFNFRLFGLTSNDAVPVNNSLPHSQSQVFTSSVASQEILPAKRFRPRPRSEIICEADASPQTVDNYSRRRSFNPVTYSVLLTHHD